MLQADPAPAIRSANQRAPIAGLPIGSYGPATFAIIESRGPAIATDPAIRRLASI
jgi:hypothetical protein